MSEEPDCDERSAPGVEGDTDMKAAIRFGSFEEGEVNSPGCDANEGNCRNNEEVRMRKQSSVHEHAEWRCIISSGRKYQCDWCPVQQERFDLVLDAMHQINLCRSCFENWAGHHFDSRQAWRRYVLASLGMTPPKKPGKKARAERKKRD